MALINDVIGKRLLPKFERPILRDSTVKAVQTVAKQELAPGTRLAATARKLLAEVQETAYTHVPEFDPAHGILKCDCSELINYVVKLVNPKALEGLPTDAGHPWTRAHNFEEFFETLPLVGKPGKQAWRKVEKASHLAPGDVVAWKNAAYVPGKGQTGHVMLVADKPRPVHVDGLLKGFDVPVIDSTSHGHGLGDLRNAERNGLGQGTIFIPTDLQGLPTGFQWESSLTPNPTATRPNTMAFGRLAP
jgi:hypothetical protein